jgi:hypothetical protein
MQNFAFAWCISQMRILLFDTCIRLFSVSFCPIAKQRAGRVGSAAAGPDRHFEQFGPVDCCCCCCCCTVLSFFAELKENKGFKFQNNSFFQILNKSTEFSQFIIIQLKN